MRTCRRRCADTLEIACNPRTILHRAAARAHARKREKVKRNRWLKFVHSYSGPCHARRSAQTAHACPQACPQALWTVLASARRDDQARLPPHRSHCALDAMPTRQRLQAFIAHPPNRIVLSSDLCGQKMSKHMQPLAAQGLQRRLHIGVLKLVHRLCGNRNRRARECIGRARANTPIARSKSRKLSGQFFANPLAMLMPQRFAQVDPESVRRLVHRLCGQP